METAKLLLLTTFALGLCIDLVPSEALQNNGDRYICRTDPCKRQAEIIKSSMDDTVGPCEDFYSYACGGWIKEHQDKEQYDVFQMLLEEQMKSMEEVLKTMPPAGSTQNVFNKAALLYEACLRVPDKNPDLTTFSEMMKDAGLEKWPIFSDSTESEQAFESFTSVLLKAGTSPFIEYYIAPGVSKPTEYVLKLFPFSFKKIGSEPHIEATLKFVKSEVSERAIKAATTAIFKFEEELIKVVTLSASLGARSAGVQVVNMSSLQELFPQFPLKTFLDKEFKKADITLKNEDTVELYNPQIHKGILDFLNTADTGVIYNYIGVHFVLSLAMHVSVSFPGLSTAQKKPPRGGECVGHVNSVMKEVMTHLFVKEKISPYAKTEITDIVNRLKESFLDTLKNVPWMDTETIAEAEKKLERMKAKLGYPAWIMDTKALEERYKYVAAIDQSTPFVKLLYAVTENNDKIMIQKFRQPYDSEKDWLPSPSPVHALYNPASNQIVYPPGALQPPMYGQGLPKAVNFGAIGAILGHEMSHGFVGRASQYDSQGQRRDWWTEETKHKFKDTEKCFKSQYGDIVDKTTSMKLNGDMTFDENVADNGGLHIALKAYRKLVNEQCKGTPTARLDGLDDLTGEKLLVLSYAMCTCDFPFRQSTEAYLTDFIIRCPYMRTILHIIDKVWCSTATKEHLATKITKMRHSPNEYRVKIPLENLSALAGTFNCTSRNHESKAEKCSLWGTAPTIKVSS